MSSQSCHRHLSTRWVQTHVFETNNTTDVTATSVAHVRASEVVWGRDQSRLKRTVRAGWCSTHTIVRTVAYIQEQRRPDSTRPNQPFLCLLNLKIWAWAYLRALKNKVLQCYPLTVPGVSTKPCIDISQLIFGSDTDGILNDQFNTSCSSRGANDDDLKFQNILGIAVINSST